MISFQELLLELSSPLEKTDLFIKAPERKFPPGKKEKFEKRIQRYDNFRGAGGNQSLETILEKAGRGDFAQSPGLFLKKLKDWCFKNKETLAYIDIYLEIRHGVKINPEYKIEKQSEPAEISKAEKRRRYKQQLAQQGKTSNDFIEFINQHNKQDNFNIGMSDRFLKNAENIANDEVRSEIYSTLRNFVNEIGNKGLNNIIQNKTFAKTDRFTSSYTFEYPDKKRKTKIRGNLYKGTLKSRTPNKDLVMFMDIPKADPPEKRHVILLGVIHHDDYWNEKTNKADQKKLAIIQKRMENLAQKYFDSSIRNRPMRESLEITGKKSFSTFLTEIKKKLTKYS